MKLNRSNNLVHSLEAMAINIYVYNFNLNVVVFLAEIIIFIQVK